MAHFKLTIGVCPDAGEGEDYRGHAQVAADEGALASLAASARSLCSSAASLDPLAGLFRSTLLVLLSSVIGAFGLSPARLPSRDLDHTLQLLETVFDGTAVVQHRIHVGRNKTFCHAEDLETNGEKNTSLGLCIWWLPMTLGPQACSAFV